MEIGDPEPPETRHLPNSQPCLGLVLLREQLLLISSQWGYSHRRGIVRFGKDHKGGKMQTEILKNCNLGWDRNKSPDSDSHILSYPVDLEQRSKI